jgi:signal transduction histidine kinase/ActR/RegA family two-component response regulator
MLRPAPLPRLVALCWTIGGLLSLAVCGVALALIEDGRDAALRSADKQVSQLVAAAESEINRNLMSVDLILAGLPDALQPALIPGGFDAEAAHRILSALQERQLMMADVTLVDESGGTVTSALAATRRIDMAPPAELLARALGPAAHSLQVSEPVIGRSSGERSLMLARALDLPGAPPLVALAEVPSWLLLSVAASREVASGMVLTLERSDGVVLVSQPPDDRLTGRRLERPLDAGQAGGESRGVAGRFDGQPVRMASRPTLYAQLLIAATLPESVALEAWSAQRARIGAVAAAFVVMIMGVAALAYRQITGLATARHQAAESEALLNEALASMGDAFLLCDVDDRVVRWNDRYLALFPWLKPVIGIGVPFQALADAAARHEMGVDADSRVVQAWVDSRLDARRQIHDEFLQTLQGSTVVSTVERRTPDGGMVSVYRDMSQKEAQLSRAMRAAEAASEAKSQFLANMSHEIRTPLNAVLGLNGLLLKSSLDAEQRHYAELVQSSGQLLLSLINDILDLSRIDAGRIDLQPVSFDMRVAAGEVVTMLQPRAQAQGLLLTCHVDPGVPPLIVADAFRVRQVLLNLIGNALKFTESGSVVVRIHHGRVAAESHLVMEVEDTGIGIAPEALPHLFQRFTQVDASAVRRRGGSGLGLSIAREVVQCMGGDIIVRSTPGKGSCFTATVRCEPGTQALRELDGPAGFARASSWLALSEDADLRILVAEDNEVNQVVIVGQLNLLGHRPTTVVDGRQALARAAEGGWDVVLMDMQMPELDGLAATRAIRQLPPPFCDVPIIAMTANARDEDRAACLAAGMDDFVSKPVNVKALQSALARAVRNRVGSI